MKTEEQTEAKKSPEALVKSSDLLCPDCGGIDFETWEELEYENSDDPTPEYGRALSQVEFHRCKNTDCGCVF